MSDDTRKDPRTKFVSLNVRYKSATVDEFIENHSHDVSKGGIFIKTNSPFATGTLLKFEIRLAADEPVIAGVGRVVWKREAAQAGGGERPAGMGVKFIKVDDSSKGVIDKLVTAHDDAGAAFEAGESGEGQAPAAEKKEAAPAAVPLPKPAGPAVKRTMMGLGAVPAAGAKPTATLSKTVPQAPAAKATEQKHDGGGFFPKTNSEADMPPPEERTVMRQAAELLEEALKEAGGSMDEVGKMAPAVKPEPPPPAAGMKAVSPEPEKKSDSKTDDAPSAAMGIATLETKSASTPPTPAPAVDQTGPKAEPAKPPTPTKRADSPTPVGEKKAGSSSAMMAGLALVLIGAGAFGAYEMGLFGATPATTASATATPPPPSVAPSAPPSVSAAPSVSVATPTIEASTVDAAPAVSATATTAPTFVIPHPSATTTTTTTTTATPSVTATTKPTAVPVPSATTKPTAVPVPKPSATESDNPY